MTTSTLSSPSQQYPLGPTLLNALIAGLIAAVANLLIFFIGSALVGGIQAALTPGAAFEPLPFAAVIASSILPMLVAGFGLWVAARFIPRGVLVWQITAVVLTLLSLGGPFGGQIATTSGAILLASMHLVVGGIMVWFLTLRQA